MSGDLSHWPGLSFLEGLRPGPGEEVELALLASYSADLSSIGAILLALAAKDSEAGRGSPSDFAESVERLRGKVRIILQRGRLARTRRTPRIAAVLDQFVREVDFDEARHSWHPKAALVRIRNTDGRTSWRLWIGSRNLTECVNRDTGLLLVSAEKAAASIPGAEALARALAERAALKGHQPAALATAVSRVAWCAPAGVRVERLHWLPGAGEQALPFPPPAADEIVIVSPFADQSFLARQTSAGNERTRRVLLTTMREIERIGPSLASFDELLILDAPEYPMDDVEPVPPGSALQSGEDQINNEEEEIGRGLHAKLLFVRADQSRRLWLGSANATMRAWSGRNAEVMAELLVTEPVARGLRALLGSARPVEAPIAEYVPDAAIKEDEALERARAQVAARWAAELAIDDECVRLTHTSGLHPGGPHPDEPEIALEVGALHGALVSWRRGQAVIDLGLVAVAERSEFVRLRVSRGGKGLCWLQRAPAAPPLTEARDRAAFVRLLGARGFLLWVAGLLADDGRDGEGDWTHDEPGDRTGHVPGASLDPSLPTMEEMLAAWARDPQKFREIERQVSRYLPAVLEQARRDEPQTEETLRSFEDLWRKVLLGLGVGAAGDKRS